MNWIFLPYWGTGLLLILWVAFVGLALLRLQREARLCSWRTGITTCLLRCVGVTALLVLALNPTALLEKTQPGKPRLAMLLDNSGSMLVRDCADKSRLEAARALLVEATPGFDRFFECRSYLFDSQTRPAQILEADGSGSASDIGRALHGAVEEVIAPADGSGGHGENSGAILLLSDGRATTGGTLAAAQYALARSVPVWVLPLGAQVQRRDLRIGAPANEVPAFAGEDLVLTAYLQQQGYPNRSFVVELIREGQKVQSFEVIPSEDGTAEISANVHAPESGEVRYDFRVAPEPDEADTGNNELPVYVRVGAQKARVLLVEGQPHWDSKFLVQLLKRDPRIEITALYRLGKERSFAVLPDSSGDLEEREGLFPETPEDFARYDVVILGKSCEAFFTPRTPELLLEYVNNGGAIIFARGRSTSGESAITRLEPLIFEGNEGRTGAVRFTPSCAEQGIIPGLSLKERTGDSNSEVADKTAALPELDRIMPVAGIRPLAQTLATASETPVLVWQRYGHGRACQLNMGGLWRWGFSGDKDAEKQYTDLWRGLLRWLMAGEGFRAGHTVTLASQRRVYSDDEQPQFIIKTRNVDPALFRPHLQLEHENPETANAADGRAHPDSPRIHASLSMQHPGVWSAAFPPLVSGTYRALLRSDTGTPRETSVSFRVVPSSQENLNLSADPELLRQIAELSGGRMLSAGEIGQLEGIYREYTAGRSMGEDKAPLWDRWWLLLAVAAVFGYEWYLRRREGMV